MRYRSLSKAKKNILAQPVVSDENRSKAEKDIKRIIDNLSFLENFFVSNYHSYYSEEVLAFLKKRAEEGSTAPSKDKQEKEKDKSLICPLTNEMFKDPVVLVESGNTYEREAILEYLKYNEDPVDPVSKKKITSKIISPNLAIKEMIQKLEENK